MRPFPDQPVVIGINSFGFGGANGHCVVREYRPAQPRLWSMPLAPQAGFMIPLVGAHVQGTGRERTTSPRHARRAYAGPLRATLAISVAAAGPISPRHRAIDCSSTGAPIRRPRRAACFEVPQAALDECALAQPVIFTLQCALVELFKTWGGYPDCVVGHSSGEVAAAYASGALSLAGATRLVFHRATLQQRTAGSGRMLAIGLDRPGVEELLDGPDVPFRLDGNRPVQVEIACENAPANTVICGRESDLQPVMEELDRRSLQNRLIPGNIAFHSRAMDTIKGDVLDALSFLDDRGFDGDVPFVSSVTGVETERLDSAYWWSNIRQPVRFAAAMETVKRDHRPVVVLELAPHSALQPLVAQCTVEDPRRAYAEELMSATNVVDTLAGIHRIDMDEPEEDFMLLMLAFATWIITVAHHVPAYGRWLADTGSRNAYAHHRRVMQHFTWQRRQREPE